MKTKFRKGDEVVCLHYKNKPIMFVKEIINWDGGRETEVWIADGETSWWGPESWFKKVSK